MPGIAKRRYAEAQIFGLYDDEDKVTADEAKQAYRMLQLHRDTILKYEAGTLVESFDPAKDSLIDWLKDKNPDLNLNPDSYLSTNIYLDPVSMQGSPSPSSILTIEPRSMPGCIRRVLSTTGATFSSAKEATTPSLAIEVQTF